MVPLSQERRQNNRRADARGGRRATDTPALSIDAIACPSCGEAANEVGESDGGWWFVCNSCDRLWNERKRPADNLPSSMLRDIQQSAS